MGYTLVLKRAAAKALSSLPEGARDGIERSLSALAENPRHPGVKRLQGSPFHRSRSGPYRIIYEIRDAELVVLVVRIADRKDAYR